VAGSVFTEIIEGRAPGRLVWRDDEVAALLSIHPGTPGHTLVVPRLEVDDWTEADDVSDEILIPVLAVARHLGRAMKVAWAAPRATLIIEGSEVPHLHVHVMPNVHGRGGPLQYGIDFAPSAESLDDARDRIRAALRTMGLGEFVPTD
jgi:diadenosine tetraphosphate (Ap4A) HIT family hydrolase